jgi:dsDNA-specific endonuclease/ATPase MutS2
MLEQQVAELRLQQEDFERWRQRVTTLKPGDRVHVRSFNRDGTVVRLQLHKQQAVVAVGSVEVEVALADVRPQE